MKIGCVIQGNVRRNTALVCQVMLQHFDSVIFSTWEGEDTEDVDTQVKVLKLKKPAVAGYGHRNFQRYSVSQGIRLAETLGCSHILKWRSDMIPANLNVSSLMEKSNFNIPIGMKSRVISGVERCITCKLDFQSSLCDFYAFGHIEDMKMLWGDEDFDYGKPFNLPSAEGEIPTDIITNGKVPAYYCSEAELYAIFKDRLAKRLGLKLNHPEILRSYFYLISADDLQVVWFGDHYFRPILDNGGGWTIKVWKGAKQPTIVDMMAVKRAVSLQWDALVYRMLGKLEGYKQTKYLSKLQGLSKRV